MALLGKMEILQASDLQHEDVPCPEWGGEVRLRNMTGAERDELEASIFHDGTKDLTNLRARVVAMAAIDADGNRLFSAEDVLALSGKSAKPLERLFERAQELSAMTDSDVEKLVGNSEAGQAGDSTSSSPQDLAAPSDSSSPELTPQS